MFEEQEINVRHIIKGYSQSHSSMSDIELIGEASFESDLEDQMLPPLRSRHSETAEVW